jgi:hypothetical protein
MAAPLTCPQCKNALGLLDVAREFQCPKGSSELVSTGWGAVRIVDGLSFILGGCVIAILWAGFGWLGGLLATVVLIAGEVHARRALLTIEPAVKGLGSNAREAT